MQSATQRAELITNIRARVCQHVAARLTEYQAVQIAIAAAMRDSDDVIGFLLPSHLAKTANKAKENFKLSEEEWVGLFGCHTQPARDGGVGAIVTSKEFLPQVTRLQNVLKQTVAEKDQASLWEKSWCKVACYVAMHLELPDELITGTLGTVIKADARRIEEMYNEIDDDGPEVMLISQCIIALSQSLL